MEGKLRLTLRALRPECSLTRVTFTNTVGAAGTRADEVWEVPTFSETLVRPPSQRPALAAGLRIGPYEIEREIGRGGMGTVYLASRADEAFEKKVAIKVVRGALGSAEAVERFKRELLLALEHLEGQPGPEAVRRATREALVQLYETWGKPEEAAGYPR